MVLGIETNLKRIAIYERVSSQNQREKETILTQRQELDRKIAADPSLRVTDRYTDDGFSGLKPLAERPDGARMIQDARRAMFEEVWVYKVDRLARDEVDALVVRRDFIQMGIKLVSVCENIEGDLNYGIRAILGGEEVRTFRARSAAGMERAVKEGRFPGGLSALGYEVEGHKQHAKIVISSRLIWKDWTAAELVRHIYDLLGVQGWSCVRIANYLNSLGVPTAYQHREPGTSRAKRGTGLQAKWRAGRIRNLVILTIYKGIYQYGKRSKNNRPVWEIPTPRLVSDELWQAAQETLARNKIQAKNTVSHYLLTGLMKCGICGKTYCCAHGRDEVLWWRCNGRMTSRYDAENRCNSKAIKGNEIESIVWNDIEQWLLNPGDLIKELENEQDKSKNLLIEETERMALGASLTKLESERKGYLRQNAQGILGESELREFLTELEQRKATIQKRLDEMKPQDQPEEDALPADLLKELRRRVKEGLSEEKRQEIARLLVRKITVKTEGNERKSLVEIDYRFPVGAVSTRTDRDS